MRGLLTSRGLQRCWAYGRQIIRVTAHLAGTTFALVSTQGARHALWDLWRELRTMRSLASIRRRKGDD